jgi:hypothetical protein
MTVGAVSNMGYGVMGRYNGYNDPYFMQAYNSLNSNYQLAQQQAQMDQQAQAASQAQSQSVDPTQTSPSFQGGASDAIQAEAKEEGSSIGKWILGIGSLAALAWGGYKCFKKGNGEGLAKIWDGAKQYLDDGCKWVKKLVGKADDVAAKVDDVAAKADDVFTITKNGSDVVCTIPGKNQVLRGANLTDDIAKLGSSTTVPSLAEKGTEILKYEAKLSDGSTITVMGDKIRSVVKPDGTKVALDKLSEAGNAEVTRIINGVKNREQATLASLQNVIGRETNNGVTRKFVTQATDATLDGVRSARTNKFLLDSPTVKAYRQQNSAVSEVIDEFTKDVTSRFNVYTADKVTDIGTFKIIGDKVAGIDVNGCYYPAGTDEFLALQFDHKDIFDGVLSDSKLFSNVVYQVK